MERANTLIQISARNLPETVVMIHDYERVSYQRATKLFTKRFSFFAFNPAVGMVWKGRSVNKFALRMLDFTLHRYSSRAAPDNVLQWKEYFDKTLFL